MTAHLFIIGAQRSGTTYLYELLAQHPHVCMARPLRPEPKFFIDDAAFRRGRPAYEEHFAHCGPGIRIRGEKSTTYVESEVAAARIRRWFPEARILVMLRDPIHRAISNYRFSCDNGLETLDIDEAFLREEQRVAEYTGDSASTCPLAYLRRGKYIDYLRVYLRYFDRRQIHLMVQEQFLGSQPELARLFQFLSLEQVPIEMDFVANASRTRLPAMKQSTRRFLTDYFTESNEQLEQEFDLDLSAWRSNRPATA